MSDLWAQFSLGIVNVSWSTTDTYPYEAAPVDDHANSIQGIDGVSYLVSAGVFQRGTEFGSISIDSDLGGDGAYQNTSTEYGLWQPLVGARLTLPSDNIATLNDVVPAELGSKTSPMLPSYQPGKRR